MNRIFATAITLCAASTAAAQQTGTTSVLEIIDTVSGERTVVAEFPYLIEAPNWTPDGQWLVYNSRGKLYKISPERPRQPELIDTDFADRCNNDHVISADGKQIAISHGTAGDGHSRIYTLPFGGGKPELVTPKGPSYLHGWSPDLRWLSYCADRGGNYDVYVISAEGGEEKRLTTAEGLDDGPEYSPDGKYIWFNSVRTGLMQVWRMKTDGSKQTQVSFHDDRNSWFPHVSPDGKQIVYIAYRKGDVDPGSHPPDKNVELWLMSTKGGEPRRIAELFGGQGTINVNSWAPDSRRLAFVSYRHENFVSAGDIGDCNLPGSTVFDRGSGVYTLSGSGTNMWGEADAFQFAWREQSGDFVMGADLAFVGQGVNVHRKAGIILRESLEADSPCVYLAVHGGDGLTELQYRETKGAETKNVTSTVNMPSKIEFSRNGDKFSIHTGHSELSDSPDAEITLKLPQKCLLGMFVCSHDNDVLESVEFSEVWLKAKE